MRIIASLAALASLLLAACAPAPAAQSTMQEDFVAGDAPALWRISDEDTTIWLFGTIHILPPNYQWRNERIDTAIESADELVIETVLSDEASASAALLMRLGVTSGLPQIGERVSAEKRPELAAMIARGPFPESFLNGLDTWAAALMLVAVTLNDLDLESGSGVDDQLELIFQLSGRPISGLETPEQQLGYFDTLPEAAQREFLESVIESPDVIRNEFDSMLAAWSAGDEAAIARTFDDELSQFADLYDALIVRRNVAWSQWITQRMEQPGEVFVAVGAGHLVGRDSVQRYLRDAGFHSVRVQ